MLPARCPARCPARGPAFMQLGRGRGLGRGGARWAGPAEPRPSASRLFLGSGRWVLGGLTRHSSPSNSGAGVARLTQPLFCLQRPFCVPIKKVGGAVAGARGQELGLLESRCHLCNLPGAGLAEGSRLACGLFRATAPLPTLRPESRHSGGSGRLAGRERGSRLSSGPRWPPHGLVPSAGAPAVRCGKPCSERCCPGREWAGGGGATGKHILGRPAASGGTLPPERAVLVWGSSGAEGGGWRGPRGGTPELSARVWDA